MLPILVEFRDAVVLARRLITTAHTVDAAGAYLWPENDRLFVVEAAFLRVFIGWETLQEKTFIEYLMGGASAAGNVMARYAQPSDRVHANNMLVGCGRFVDWSTPDSVRKLAKNFLANGEPFERVLTSINSDLLDLKTVRNAAAHLSTTTAQPLDGLASRRLQRNISGMSAAQFLLSTDPAATPNTTIFDGFVVMLDAAAHAIVHS